MINFLKDVQEYPDSGIAARYKRLGITVKQGQELKAKLSQDGLIEEHKEITRTGRRTTIVLTEKAQTYVNGDSYVIESASSARSYPAPAQQS